MLYGRFPLAILHINPSHQLISPSSYLPCPHIHSQCLCLCSLFANRFICSSVHFSRFHIYVLIYNICFILSDFTLYQFSSVQLLSHVQLFVTPWTAAHQASQSITNSWSLLRLTSIESVMPSNNLNLCHPLLLPPSNLPSIRVFSNESTLRIRWPKYWSFSFNISPSNAYLELNSFRD